MLIIYRIIISLAAVLGTISVAWAQEEKVEAKATLNFIYMSVNDLEAMRHFYTDLVGLDETNYQAGPQGWLVYQCGGLEFMLFPSGYELPAIEGWGMQPGWPGGTVEGISWSVLIPGERFENTVKALLADNTVECLFEEPQWCQWSYWSFPVRDPMGNTVEIHFVPEGDPVEERQWEWMETGDG